MLIIILVKKNLPGHFSDIKSSIVGAGIMGLMVLFSSSSLARSSL